MVLGGMMCMNVSGKATVIGVCVMFGSHFAEAIRTVGAQWLLVDRKFGVIESMYYFAPATWSPGSPSCKRSDTRSP
jgi:hypothetical protein